MKKVGRMSQINIEMGNIRGIIPFQHDLSQNEQECLISSIMDEIVLILLERRKEGKISLNWVFDNKSVNSPSLWVNGRWKK